MPGKRRFRLAVAGLIASHIVILFPGFFSPYDPDEQNRRLALAPPTRIHFLDARTGFHWRPFVYRMVFQPGSFNEYQEDESVLFPIRFLVTGTPHTVLGAVPSRRHLMGTDQGGHLFLLGTDTYGRDEFSRLLYGGRISLFTGLLATALSLSIGVALGGLAGYYGRWIDDFIMGGAEMFMIIPWLYLLLSVRAALPLNIGAERAFLLLVTVLGLVGWARPARLVRGVVLSVRQREYVAEAEAFGAPTGYILRRHILPQASGIVLTQTLLYIPQYVLAETTLSFFGLGVSEPAPSWGNMLAGLQAYPVLRSCWWMFAPGAALIVIFLLYQRLFSYYSHRKESLF